MYKYVTRQKASKQLADATYTEKEFLPNGRLPTEKNVLEVMMFLLRPDRAGKQQLGVQEAAQTLSPILMEHWMFCNIFTITVSI